MMNIIMNLTFPQGNQVSFLMAKRLVPKHSWMHLWWLKKPDTEI